MNKDVRYQHTAKKLIKASYCSFELLRVKKQRPLPLCSITIVAIRAIRHDELTSLHKKLCKFNCYFAILIVGSK